MKIKTNSTGSLLSVPAGFISFLASASALAISKKLESPLTTVKSALELMADTHIKTDIVQVIAESRKLATLAGVYDDQDIKTAIALLEKQASLSPEDAQEQFGTFYAVLQAKLDELSDVETVDAFEVRTPLVIADIIDMPAQTIVETRSSVRSVLDVHGFAETPWALGYVTGLSNRLSSTAEDGDVAEVPAGTATTEQVIAGAQTDGADNQRATG